MDLDGMTASEAVGFLADGSLGSQELLDACLERVEARNGELGAVVALDVERARARCRAADDATARGERWGPLHGLPMTVKDSFETEGLTTTSGAPELRHHVPERDADVVRLLKAAGAVIFGKTNLPLYAGDFQTRNELHGTCRNPWDPSRTAGGSSGGAAVAVATGMSLLELGSDIGGSIRAPAHYNGVAGHKPTWGAISDRGHIPGPPGTLGRADLGVIGPLGRSVDDLEMALDVLVGPDLAGVPGGRLPAASPASAAARGLRVGVWAEDPAVPTSGAVVRAVRDLAADLAAAGAEVDEAARPGPPLEELSVLYVQLLSAVMSAGLPPRALATLRAVLEGPPDQVDALTRAQARGALSSHAEWLVADEGRHRAAATWAQFFERYDVVLAPVSPVPAFPHDLDRPFGARQVDVDGTAVPYLRLVVWPGLATLPGLPATAVPVARTPDGLPIGVQVIGPRWGDRTTLAVGRLIEATGRRFGPPPTATARPSGG